MGIGCERVNVSGGFGFYCVLNVWCVIGIGDYIGYFFDYFVCGIQFVGIYVVFVKDGYCGGGFLQ